MPRRTDIETKQIREAVIEALEQLQGPIDYPADLESKLESGHGFYVNRHHYPTAEVAERVADIIPDLRPDAREVLGVLQSLEEAGKVRSERKFHGWAWSATSVRERIDELTGNLHWAEMGGKSGAVAAVDETMGRVDRAVRALLGQAYQGNPKARIKLDSVLYHLENALDLSHDRPEFRVRLGDGGVLEILGQREYEYRCMECSHPAASVTDLCPKHGDWIRRYAKKAAS